MNAPTITAERSAAAGVVLDGVRGVHLDARKVLVCSLAEPHADNDLALPDCCWADLLTTNDCTTNVSNKHIEYDSITSSNYL